MEYMRRHPIACVLVFVFVCLCPVMATRDFSYANELRYLSIVDEAFRDGHVFAFYNHGLAYADKPPLYFWLMMLCKLIVGKHSMFALSMLSLIPAFVIVLVMDKWLRQAFSSESQIPVMDRVAMALMLLTSGLFLGISAFLRMDMLMCMFIVLALHSFWVSYEGLENARLQLWMFPVWTFMALFSKGPVGILIPPVAVLVFLLVKKEFRLIGRYLGIRTWAIIGLLSAAWIFCAYLDGGQEYINNLLFDQTVGRAVQATQHNQPFWYYAAMIWPVMLPYALMTIPVVIAWFFKKGEKTSFEGILMAAICSGFVMLSCFSSKLTIYLAPLFPLIVYMFYPMVQTRIGWTRALKIAAAVPAIVYIIIGLALAAVFVGVKWSYITPEMFKDVERFPYAGSGLVLAGAVIMIVGGVYALARDRRCWQKPVISMAVSLLMGFFTIGLLVPQANEWLGYRHMCQVAMELAPGEPVNTLFVSRPENMDVFLGEEPVDFKKDPSEFYKANPHGILIVKTRKIDTTLQTYLHGCTMVQSGEFSVYKLDR